MKSDVSKAPTFYTGTDWINKKDIPLSNWPINKKAKHPARLKSAGVGKANAYLRRLDAPPAPVCTHCAGRLGKDNTSGLCRGCWRLGHKQRSVERGRTVSGQTKTVQAFARRLDREEPS